MTCFLQPFWFWRLSASMVMLLQWIQVRNKPKIGLFIPMLAKEKLFFVWILHFLVNNRRHAHYRPFLWLILAILIHSVLKVKRKDSQWLTDVLIPSCKKCKKIFRKRAYPRYRPETGECLNPASVSVLYPIRNGYHVYLLLLSSKYSQFLCSVDFKHVPMCFASLTSLRKWSRENRSVPLYVCLVPSRVFYGERIQGLNYTNVLLTRGRWFKQGCIITKRFWVNLERRPQGNNTQS